MAQFAGRNVIAQRGLAPNGAPTTSGDHARIGFTQMKPGERRGSAIAILSAAVVQFAGVGVTRRRVATDKGSAFRSKRFAAACGPLGLKRRLTGPYRPQTNGKVERLIQSALRDWAYGIPYQDSTERTAMLERWTQHQTGITRTTP